VVRPATSRGRLLAVIGTSCPPGRRGKSGKPSVSMSGGTWVTLAMVATLARAYDRLDGGKWGHGSHPLRGSAEDTGAGEPRPEAREHQAQRAGGGARAGSAGGPGAEEAVPPGAADRPQDRGYRDRD